jgi:hypothetical protein
MIISRLRKRSLNNKLLRDRKTDEEIRDGLILFHHVFGVCVLNDAAS